MTTGPRWHIILDGSSQDIECLKRHFGSSGFTFDNIDGHFALAPPEFHLCSTVDNVVDAATTLLSRTNTSLRISTPRFNGLEMHGVAEQRDGIMHRVMMARGDAYGLSGVSGVGSVGAIGAPQRTKEERLASLITSDTRVAEIARDLALRPNTWGNLNKAYETVVGLASPTGSRQDWQYLVAQGWLSSDENTNFYHTAGYHRHGYPKAANKAPQPMDYEIACQLIKRLLWRLVDHLEPT